MKTYDILNKWAQLKFDELGYTGHYSAGEVLNYDGGIKDSLYFQRNPKSKNITYFRYCGKLGNIGARWIDKTVWSTPVNVQLDYFWLDIKFFSKKSYNIFQISKKGITHDNYKIEFGFVKAFKNIPFVKPILSGYKEWKNWSDQFLGIGVNEDGTKYSIPDPKRSSFIKYVWEAYKRRQKIKLCNHSNMEVDADINGDSGSEDFFCSDCGFNKHIQYY